MAKIKITQIKSAIDRPAIQKRTIRALGITRVKVPVIKEATPQILGMVKAVGHMLKVENVD